MKKDEIKKVYMSLIRLNIIEEPYDEESYNEYVEAQIIEDLIADKLSDSERSKNTETSDKHGTKQLNILDVVHSAYLCKNVNGEDCIIIAENIDDVFDKLEKITPCPEDATVSGKSTRVYY